MQPDLIARIEAAQPSEAREVFREAFRAVFQPVRSAENTIEECEAADMFAFHFSSLLDIGTSEALLGAAAMFVPEGWSIGLGDLRGYDPIVWRAHLRDCRPESLTPAGHTHIWCEGHASTHYYALLAAAMKARQTDER